MYNLRFESNSGKTLILNYENDIIIRRVTGANGIGMSLGLSQGYQQIGQAVVSTSVNGMSLTIEGYILDGNTQRKRDLLQAFAPFSSGRLWWEDKYFVDVVVQNSPTISQRKHSTFSFRLYSKTPYWSKKDKVFSASGGTLAEFKFPINYSTPHRFGTKSFSDLYNIINSGDVKTAFDIEISGSETIRNPKIINRKTGEFLLFNCEILAGEKITLTQTEENIIVTKKHVDGSETNEFSILDDFSTFFTLDVGDNIINTEAESGEYNMEIMVSFYPLLSGVLANGV